MKPRSTLLLWITVVAAGVIPPLLGYQVVLRIAERDWTEVRKRAVAARVPISLKDALNGYAPGADSENAAEGMKAAIRDINELVLKDRYLPDAQMVFDDDRSFADALKSGRAARVVRKLSVPLERFESTLLRPHWNYKRNWEYVPQLYGEDARVTSLGRMLQARAITYWKEDSERSLRAIRSLIRFGDHMASEPYIISIKSASTIQRMGYQTAINLAATPSTPSAPRQRLLQLIAKPRYTVDWRWCWRVDHASQLHLMETYTSHRDLHMLGDNRVVRSKRAMHQARAGILRLMIEAEEVLQHGPTDPRVIKDASTRFSSEIMGIATDYAYEIGYYSSETEYEEAANAYVAAEAYRRLAYLAIKVFTGKGKLTTLPPEMALPEWSDPFTGKPFLLKRATVGFSIYSVGPDGNDDGGSDARPYGKEPLDLVATST